MFHLGMKARKAKAIEWRRQFRPAFRYSFLLSQVVAVRLLRRLSSLNYRHSLNPVPTDGWERTLGTS